jgi:hypothetical protein
MSSYSRYPQPQIECIDLTDDDDHAYPVVRSGVYSSNKPSHKRRERDYSSSSDSDSDSDSDSYKRRDRGSKRRDRSHRDRSRDREPGAPRAREDRTYMMTPRSRDGSHPVASLFSSGGGGALAPQMSSFFQSGQVAQPLQMRTQYINSKGQAVERRVVKDPNNPRRNLYSQVITYHGQNAPAAPKASKVRR